MCNVEQLQYADVCIGIAMEMYGILEGGADKFISDFVL